MTRFFVKIEKNQNDKIILTGAAAPFCRAGNTPLSDFTDVQPAG